MTRATSAVGIPLASSHSICHWLRATGSVARRYRCSTSSTDRCGGICQSSHPPSLHPESHWSIPRSREFPCPGWPSPGRSPTTGWSTPSSCVMTSRSTTAPPSTPTRSSSPSTACEIPKAVPCKRVSRPYDRTEVVDEFTVAIHLTRPFGPLMANLSHSATAPISPTAAKKAGSEFAQQPVGTGPFMFEKWEGNDLHLVRYHGLQLATGRDGPHRPGLPRTALSIRKSPRRRPG